MPCTRHDEAEEQHMHGFIFQSLARSDQGSTELASGESTPSGFICASSACRPCHEGCAAEKGEHGDHGLTEALVVAEEAEHRRADEAVSTWPIARPRSQKVATRKQRTFLSGRGSTEISALDRAARNACRPCSSLPRQHSQPDMPLWSGSMGPSG
jgi:hypothetical protein